MVSRAQDTLELPDKPGPMTANDNDPVVQEGEHLGSGVGFGEGDHVKAVVKVTDEKDISTHSGIMDDAQPITEISVPEVEVPSSPLIQKPGDEKADMPTIQKSALSTFTTSPQGAVHPEGQATQSQKELTGVASTQESSINIEENQKSPQDKQIVSPSGETEEGCKQSSSPAKVDDTLQDSSAVHLALAIPALPSSSVEDIPVPKPDIQPPTQAPRAPGSSPAIQDGITKHVHPLRDGDSTFQTDDHDESRREIEIAEVESGAFSGDQDLQGMTLEPELDELPSQPVERLLEDAVDRHKSDIDSEKPIERDKGYQQGSGLDQDNQDLRPPDATQTPAQPTIEDKAPTSDTETGAHEIVQDELVDDAEIIPERKALTSGDQTESEVSKRNPSPTSPTREAAQEETQQEKTQPQDPPLEDIQQEALPEQRIAEGAYSQDVANTSVPDSEQQAIQAFDPSQNEEPLQDASLGGDSPAAADIVVHEILFHDRDGKGPPDPIDESIDMQGHGTADKATGTLGEEAPAERDVVGEARHIFLAELDGPEAMPPRARPSESSTMVDKLSSIQDQAIQDQKGKPSLGRADSSTQTDELWRPITPIQRGAIPSIVVPDLNNEEAKGMSQVRSKRRRARRNTRQAEEAVFAAGSMRAAADTVDKTSAMKPGVVKDLKQHGEATAPSHLLVDGRGTGVAVTDTYCGPNADLITGKEPSKTDEPVPGSPRTREHRSSHSSRSDRPSTRDGLSKDGAVRSSHHRHSSHRLRPDGEREPEQTSPRTPLRRRDTADSAQGSHNSRSRRERTPQEQADHDRRKEERRLAREREKEAMNREAGDPAPADRPKSSRRHSSSRNAPEAPAATPSKKFFGGESVLESSFGRPLASAPVPAPAATKEKDGVSSSRRSKDITRPPPAELKRSNTSRSNRAVHQSMEQANVKPQKETVKASKDKSRGREASSSPAPSNGRTAAADEKKRRSDEKHRRQRAEKREKGEKEEKKSSGGLKGMFKKLFS